MKLLVLEVLPPLGTLHGCDCEDDRPFVINFHSRAFLPDRVAGSSCNRNWRQQGPRRQFADKPGHEAACAARRKQSLWAPLARAVCGHSSPAPRGARSSLRTARCAHSPARRDPEGRRCPVTSSPADQKDAHAPVTVLRPAFKRLFLRACWESRGL